MVYNRAHGIDERSVSADEPPKSIGAEISWGVRFNNERQVQ